MFFEMSKMKLFLQYLLKINAVENQISSLLIKIHDVSYILLHLRRRCPLDSCSPRCRYSRAPPDTTPRSAKQHISYSKTIANAHNVKKSLRVSAQARAIGKKSLFYCYFSFFGEKTISIAQEVVLHARDHRLPLFGR